jgi:hypothetical protein
MEAFDAKLSFCQRVKNMYTNKHLIIIMCMYSTAVHHNEKLIEKGLRPRSGLATERNNLVLGQRTGWTRGGGIIVVKMQR